MASPPFTIISDNIKYSELSVVTDNNSRESVCQVGLMFTRYLTGDRNGTENCP